MIKIIFGSIKSFVITVSAIFTIKVLMSYTINKSFFVLGLVNSKPEWYHYLFVIVALLPFINLIVKIFSLKKKRKIYYLLIFWVYKII